jgi:hypothetical protein
MVFQAEYGEPNSREGWPRRLIQIERYNATPPKELPPEEYIARTVSTDRNGVFTFTLTEPGWWSMTVEHGDGKKEHKGTTYPVRWRSTFWVFVDEAPPSKK